MHWDDSDYAGFSTVKPWIGPNKNKDLINVKAAQLDENSILNYYKKLFKVYKENPLVKDGVYKDLLPKHKRLFAYERRGEDELLLVISNFSKNETKCNLMKKYSEYDCEVLLNNYNEVDFNLFKRASRDSLHLACSLIAEPEELREASSASLAVSKFVIKLAKTLP
jgi:glycosidase